MPHLTQTKRAILTLLAVLLVATGAFAVPEGAGSEANAPKAVVPDPIYDFGKAQLNLKLVHDFVIRNEGKAELRIDKVQPQCSCTVTSFDQKIAPGGTGSVRAEIDTTTLRGGIDKHVTVFTNDPANPTLVLTLKALLVPHTVLAPEYVRYPSFVQGDQSAVQSLIVWTPDSPDFKILSAESPYPFLKVAFREAKDTEKVGEGQGRQWRVETVLEPTAEVGSLQGFVKLHTNHPQESVVTFPVTGFVRPLLVVTPPVADFGRLELREPLKKSIFVKNFGPDAISLTKAESTVKGVAVQVTPVKEGREFTVYVTLDPSLPKGDFSGKLLIHTTSAKKPLLEIDLRGTVL